MLGQVLCLNRISGSMAFCLGLCPAFSPKSTSERRRKCKFRALSPPHPRRHQMARWGGWSWLVRANVVRHLIKRKTREDCCLVTTAEQGPKGKKKKKQRKWHNPHVRPSTTHRTSTHVLT
ncbi:hypothetical protein QBC35DRAFT_302575 [Podospora australis]|uniref:Secreted protein n=1 Tax=Podospora australis TaxID=1536484 RepID=A0AAN6WQB3_9PEZI|nr:hypothetical protein QBC35DRAFT_302575 [Podospora australis]